jgi:hypothetical protein
MPVVKAFRAYLVMVMEEVTMTRAMVTMRMTWSDSTVREERMPCGVKESKAERSAARLPVLDVMMSVRSHTMDFSLVVVC